mgnify:CR=1 FL=1
MLARVDTLSPMQTPLQRTGVSDLSDAKTGKESIKDRGEFDRFAGEIALI